MLQPLRDLPLLRDTYQEGRSDGKTEGKAEGKAEYLLQRLMARGIAVGDEVRQRMVSCQDGARLDDWFRRALHASTLDEVLVCPLPAWSMTPGRCAPTDFGRRLSRDRTRRRRPRRPSMTRSRGPAMIGP